MTTISTEQFERARQLALRLAGIELFDRHREILARRSRRMGIENCSAFEALLEAADQGDERAGTRLVGLVTTNFTHFFRHPRHFTAAAEHAVTAVSERGRASIWSTASSTGEEPYSAAIAIIEAFGTEDPPVTILASDIDHAALDVARRAEYDGAALSTVDEGRLQMHFRPASSRSRWIVADAVRHLVKLRHVNLVDPEWSEKGPYDVIFCRNVLMYLEAGHRENVAERMASQLVPGGLLILDPAEHLGRVEPLFSHRGGGMFALRPAVRPPSVSLRARS